MFIYKISFPNNPKVYIGRTNNPPKRWWSHKNNALIGLDCHIYRAIRKYGIKTTIFEVIATCLKKEYVKEVEIDIIRQYDSFNNGYNETIGGEGRNGFKTSEKTKKKQRAASPSAIKCKVFYEDGSEEIAPSLKQFSEKRGYHQGALSGVLSGKLPYHKDIIKIEKL